MGNSKLWLGRILRLGGIALLVPLLLVFVGFLIIAPFPDVWGYLPEIILVFLVACLLAIPGSILIVVGGWVSPPDPRLDNWLENNGLDGGHPNLADVSVVQAFRALRKHWALLLASVESRLDSKSVRLPIPIRRLRTTYRLRISKKRQSTPPT